MIQIPCKNEDGKRPITIGFRVSEETNRMIDLLVAASGMTKQDYIVSKLLDREITVKASPSMYEKLRGGGAPRGVPPAQSPQEEREPV